MAINLDNQANPFEDNAVSYHMRGWHPIPLWDANPSTPEDRKNRMKCNPPKGFTGRGNPNATRAQIEEWRDSGRYFNLALRLPDNVIVIDVDAYHGGSETLADLERRYGRLPATYTSSAREDGSGHRFFSVDGRRVWKNPGEGIEVIHWGWRYVVAPPSIHPETGTPYLWRNPKGEVLANQLGPKLDQFPPLPKKWVAFLDTKKDPSVTVSRATVTKGELKETLAEWATDDEPCEHIRGVLNRTITAENGGRHDACMRAQMAILRYGEAGHPGARTACRELRDWFFAALGTERDPGPEWVRGITNAVELIKANPSSPFNQGCRPVFVFDTKTIKL